MVSKREISCLLNNNLIEVPKCPYCNKPRKFNINHYLKTCGNKECINSQAKDTLFKNYGVKTTWDSKEIRDKARNTMGERYGVEYTFQNETLKKKAIDTNKRKYGSDWYLGSKEFLDNKDEFNIQKFGVPHYAQTKEGRERLRNNWENKTEEDKRERQEKSKITCKERYGYEYSSQSPVMKSLQKKPFKYKDMYFDSSWELSFYIYHEDKGIKVNREPKSIKYFDSIDNKDRYYLPDFEIDGKLYEIKGDQFFKEGRLYNPFTDRFLDDKYQCMKDNDIILINENEIKKYVNYVKIKYGKKYLKQFKNY